MSRKGRSERANRARRAKQNAIRKGAQVAELVFYDEIFERDQGICQLCWQPVAFKKGTMDHKIPLYHGGPHIKTNVQLAHQKCNEAKGSTLNELSIRYRKGWASTSSVRSDG